MIDGAYTKLFYMDRSITQHSRPNYELLDTSGKHTNGANRIKGMTSTNMCSVVWTGGGSESGLNKGWPWHLFHMLDWRVYIDKTIHMVSECEFWFNKAW